MHFILFQFNIVENIFSKKLNKIIVNKLIIYVVSK